MGEVSTIGLDIAKSVFQRRGRCCGRGCNRQPNHPWGKLAINDHGPLSILAIALDGCNRL